VTGAWKSADTAAGVGVAPVELLAYHAPQLSGTSFAIHTPDDRLPREGLR